MYFDFKNPFIKVTRTRPIFQKFQKQIFFSFNIKDNALIYKA